MQGGERATRSANLGIGLMGIAIAGSVSKNYERHCRGRLPIEADYPRGHALDATRGGGKGFAAGPNGQVGLQQGHGADRAFCIEAAAETRR